jgi:hypothetical protein
MTQSRNLYPNHVENTEAIQQEQIVRSVGKRMAPDIPLPTRMEPIGCNGDFQVVPMGHYSTFPKRKKTIAEGSTATNPEENIDCFAYGTMRSCAGQSLVGFQVNSTRDDKGFPANIKPTID